MISYLKGTLAGSDALSAVVEVNGVGFQVGMSTKSLAKLPQTGKPVRIYTVLQVREDDMSLYGFASQEERETFTQLVNVSGIGPKVALAILSTFTPTELADAILNEDVTSITRIPGIGKKSASRIVLELKGSLEKGIAAAQGREPVSNEGLRGAAEALMAMGFTPQEAEVALQDAPAGADEGALLQYALKRLGS
jgi:Holliday junction DNA helicase RuvA